ncbi:hypothetical protein OD91_2274 [Lutibacter sp. Hel_I_33_5]|uniref:hypothetical protein n=1 Tax=Lutibacter sp. Hel_I_33_5 TaxID=1566289 RepID=UPI0011A12706|nr:hypothetical protein [Lutibacter sp. Hel_I_33_5]TVZ56970.1 hypothetical protein OD91_2274 [Lutibacter sp. Hel_I_33_5]
MIKKITLSVLFVLSMNSFSQKTINNYKYIIVPNQFEFLKQEDQYQTSSLTKFLFNKKGFTTFLNNESFPEELSRNRCLALTVKLKRNSSFLSTKNKIELLDCNNKVVFTSQEGRSKNKDYKKAYHESIRKAFKSIEALNYKYQPVSQSDKTVVSNKEISEISPLKVVKTVTQKNKGKVIKEVLPKEKLKVNENNILYAQSKENGFQLVNTKPEVVFNVLKTNKNDIFIIKDKNGILYKKGDLWFAEFYENNQKVIQKYQIKF